MPEVYEKNVIGAYGVTFNKRALFIYKTYTECEGFFIRKKEWLKIINCEDHKEIVLLLKKQLISNYENAVKSKLFKHKMENLKKVTSRTDYQYILSLTFIEKEK